MFDIGAGEFIALAVIALLVLGPERLPRYAADAARFLRQVRRMVDNAREEVRTELGPELQDLSLAELNPRTLLRKHVYDPDEDLGPARDAEHSDADHSDADHSAADHSDAEQDDDATRPSPARPTGPGAPPPYDADAT